MQIQVRLFSRFRDALPREARGEATIALSVGTTVDQLLTHLGIIDRVKLITVNGQRETDLQRVLSQGDLVYIFPPVAGG